MGKLKIKLTTFQAQANITQILILFNKNKIKVLVTIKDQNTILQKIKKNKIEKD